MSRPPTRARRAPEVIQVSAMDCGPASLFSLLAGHGIDVGYRELRDVCQTDVDGTSIDAMQDLATRLGLETEQVVVPVDHLGSDDADLLPGIVVTQIPSSGPHFVVAWRRAGPWLQVMDPAAGRTWVRRESFARRMLVLEMPLRADDWREWAGTQEFVGPLSDRMLAAGLDGGVVVATLAEALADDWRGLAAVDAATRLLATLPRRDLRGAARTRLFHALVTSGREHPGAGLVPEAFWYAREDARPGRVRVAGGVVLRVLGRREPSAPPVEAPGGREPRRLAHRLERARAPQARVLSRLWSYLRQDGVLAPAVVTAAAVLAALTNAVQALLLKGVIELGAILGVAEQRLGALVAVAALSACAALVEWRGLEGTLALGRRLEARLRRDYLAKLGRLPEEYFATRLSSDLLERLHRVTLLRQLPSVAGQLLRDAAGLVFTTAGIVWLDPRCAPLAVGAALVALGMPVAFGRLVGEQQLSVATYQGALSRHYLDALLGLAPLRAHAAQRVLRGEHDTVLGRWAAARVRLLASATTQVAVGQLLGVAFTAAITAVHLAGAGGTSSVLLLVYWAQQLPALGQGLARNALRYPAERAVAARLLDALGAEESEAPAAGPPPSAAETGGVALSLRGVEVSVCGHVVLEGIDLEVPAGCTCAVLGPSGAGKSTLLGTLLGWQRLAAGSISADGRPYDLEAMRDRIAWLDPDVYLWNRSLVDNLRYGVAPAVPLDLPDTLGRAGLTEVVNGLPEGLNTAIGEGGSLLSEGEGQRVRLARALLRRDARLVLLDEPFRGLERETRARRMAELRETWPAATLLCVTHDPVEALRFDRVVVMDQGRVVEQGAPRELVTLGGSRLSGLLAEARDVGRMFADPSRWRRIELRDHGVAAGGVSS